jgi:hypothetical protein
VSARVTRNVVGGVIGVGIVWAVFALTGWRWGAALTALLAYEGWTLANAGRDDTISEIVRTFSRRQLLVPFLFGAGYGVALATGYIADVYVAAAVGVLMGHFFFTFDEDRA